MHVLPYRVRFAEVEKTDCSSMAILHVLQAEPKEMSH